MADKTITQLTATTSAATADEIPIWVAGSAVTRKITKANFLQGAFTGGGTLATGGFTLTVPATGTAALVLVGTWTPVLAFGGASTGITYSSAAGDYVKISQMCFVRCEFTLSSKGSATGSADILGLPFSAATTNRGGMILEYAANMASVATSIYGRIGTNSVRLAAAAVDLTNANFNNNTVLRIWGVYQVA